jgi:hypothetical protein
MPTSSSEDSIKDLKKSLKEKYQGKVVILRHFYAGSQLSFDADGSLPASKEYTVCPWTLCAKVRLARLQDGRSINPGKAGRTQMLRFSI